jgi:Aldo/keto reductase family
MARPYHLVRACEASLKRLGTDHIDLYFMHGFDATTPVDETLRALDDRITSGKISRPGDGGRRDRQTTARQTPTSGTKGWVPGQIAPVEGCRACAGPEPKCGIWMAVRVGHSDFRDVDA